MLAALLKLVLPYSCEQLLLLVLGLSAAVWLGLVCRTMISVLIRGLDLHVVVLSRR